MTTPVRLFVPPGPAVTVGEARTRRTAALADQAPLPGLEPGLHIDAVDVACPACSGHHATTCRHTALTLTD